MTDLQAETLLAAAAAQPGGLGATISFLFPMVMVLLIFWILVWRPEKRRMAEHRKTIMGVQKGDRVITGGGLIGKVTKVDETEVELELGQGVKVRAVKATLSQVVDPTAKPAND
jgi:preprotein translocase subunit YajC